MEIDLIAEAFKFMILGMGTVFSFLVILIFSLKIQATLIQKYTQNPKVKHPTLQESKPTHHKKEKQAAIIAAVIQHHKNIQRTIS